MREKLNVDVISCTVERTWSGIVFPSLPRLQDWLWASEVESEAAFAACNSVAHNKNRGRYGAFRVIELGDEIIWLRASQSGYVANISKKAGYLDISHESEFLAACFMRDVRRAPNLRVDICLKAISEEVQLNTDWLASFLVHGLELPINGGWLAQHLVSLEGQFGGVASFELFSDASIDVTMDIHMGSMGSSSSPWQGPIGYHGTTDHQGGSEDYGPRVVSLPVRVDRVSGPVHPVLSFTLSGPEYPTGIVCEQTAEQLEDHLEWLERWRQAGFPDPESIVR